MCLTCPVNSASSLAHSSCVRKRSRVAPTLIFLMLSGHLIPRSLARLNDALMMDTVRLTVLGFPLIESLID